MAGNKIFVSVAQAAQQFCRRYPHKLALLPAVAALAGENQVPDAVDIRHLAARRPRDKVVNVGQVLIPAFETDRRIAVKAAAFLVAVQAVATAGDGNPSGIQGAEELLFGGIIFYGDQAAGDVHRPRLLHQTPAGVRFVDQILVLLALRQRIKVVGQTDALMRFTLVDKKAPGDFALVHVMKFIQHHAKAELNRCRDELILGYLLAIEAATGAEKLAFW